MAVSSESQGTQAATVTTEHSLATPTTAGVRVFAVDTSNMVAGDALELRIKMKVLTAGTIRVVYLGSWSDAQPADDLIKMSVPIACPFGATFTLKQTLGTSRNFDWAVYTL